ncbi:hypothetical protein IP84_03795 [beta proteobacterium AAP99]|nr:hypothetical protein IP84_03795 [beta proteobacterium AAP99]
MQLYARFAHAMRKAGVTLDLMRFVNEDAYAGVMLQQAMSSTDLDLLQLALNVGDVRKLLNGSRAASAQAAPGQAIQPGAAPSGTAASPAVSPTDTQPTSPKRFVRSLR